MIPWPCKFRVFPLLYRYKLFGITTLIALLRYSMVTTAGTRVHSIVHTYIMQWGGGGRWESIPINAD